jgi:hypothetical protein
MKTTYRLYEDKDDLSYHTCVSNILLIVFIIENIKIQSASALLFFQKLFLPLTQMTEVTDTTKIVTVCTVHCTVLYREHLSVHK